MDFKKTILAATVMCGAASNANAGGIITNTNQSVSFLRNPAREAAIGIDGVYSNPAGVMFMNEGFDGFIAKPVDIGQFERVMKRVLPEDVISFEGRVLS